MNQAVVVGSIWRDMDKRHSGRYVRVVEIKMQTDFNGRQIPSVAICQPCTERGADMPFSRPTRLSIRRMKPGSTGWECVFSPKEEVPA